MKATGWIFLAAALLVSGSAFADSRNRGTCHIVISSGTNGNAAEKFQHEIAHCNGWVHAEGVHGLKPPAKYIRKPDMALDDQWVTLAAAQKVCGGAMACQWFDNQ